MKKDLNTTVQWITLSAEAWITICVPRVENQITWTNQDESDYESARTTRTCNRTLKISENSGRKNLIQTLKTASPRLGYCPRRTPSVLSAPWCRRTWKSSGHGTSKVHSWCNFICICLKSISCHFFIRLVITNTNLFMVYIFVARGLS